MAEESDGIEEALDGALRTAITAAGQIGERISRTIEQEKRRAQAASEQEAADLRSRMEAQKQAARTELANVHRPEWWEHASSQQIADTWQVATAWSNEDPTAERAGQRMADELRNRYGIDPRNTGADPAAVREAVEKTTRNSAQPQPQQRPSEAAESVEADRLLAAAGLADRDADKAATEQEWQPAAAATEDLPHDSEARRQALAEGMEANGVPQRNIDTRMRADVSQAKPPTEATRSAGGATKARKSKSGRGAQVERTGRSR